MCRCAWAAVSPPIPFGFSKWALAGYVAGIKAFGDSVFVGVVRAAPGAWPVLCLPSQLLQRHSSRPSGCHARPPVAHSFSELLGLLPSSQLAACSLQQASLTGCAGLQVFVVGASFWSIEGLWSLWVLKTVRLAAAWAQAPCLCGMQQSACYPSP